MMESISFVLAALAYFVLLSNQRDHVNALGIHVEVNYTTNQITPTNLIASAKQQTEFASSVNTNNNTLDGNVNNMIRINELDESANMTCNGTWNANAEGLALSRDDDTLILSERGVDRFTTRNPRKLKNFANAWTNETENNFKLRRARKRRNSGGNTSKVGKSETLCLNETVNSDLFLNSSASGGFSEYIFIKDSQNISDNSSDLMENQIAFHENQLNFSPPKLSGKNSESHLYNKSKILIKANQTPILNLHPNQHNHHANSEFASGSKLYDTIHVNDEINVIGNDSNFITPSALNFLFTRETNFRVTTESTGIKKMLPVSASKNNKLPANKTVNRRRDNNSGMNLIKQTRPPDPFGNKGDETPKSGVGDLHASVPSGEGKTLLSERNKRKLTGVLRGSKSMMIKRDRSSAVTSGQFIVGNEIAPNDEESMSDYSTPEYSLSTATSTISSSRYPRLLENHLEETTTTYSKVENERKLFDPKYQKVDTTTPTISHPVTSDLSLKFDQTITINEEKNSLQPTGDPDLTLESPLLSKNLNETGTNYVVHYYESNKTKSNKAYTPSKLFNIYKDIISCTNCSNSTFASDTDNKLQTQSKVFGIVHRYKNETARNISISSSDTTPDDNSLSSTTEILNVDLDSKDALSVSTEVTGDSDGYLTGVTLITDGGEIALNATADYGNETYENGSAVAKVRQEFPWPVKKEAVVEGDLVLGGLMMIHEREDMITCGPVMPQGGIQALEAMLYTLDRLNEPPTPLLPNITLGAHILDDCDKDTYGLEMAVDFIKGKR